MPNTASIEGRRWYSTSLYGGRAWVADMRHSGHGSSRRHCSASNSLSLCDDGGIEFFVGEIGVFELMLYWPAFRTSNLYPVSVALLEPLPVSYTHLRAHATD